MCEIRPSMMAFGKSGDVISAVLRGSKLHMHQTHPDCDINVECHVHESCAGVAGYAGLVGEVCMLWCWCEVRCM